MYNDKKCKLFKALHMKILSNQFKQSKHCFTSLLPVFQNCNRGRSKSQSDTAIIWFARDIYLCRPSSWWRPSSGCLIKRRLRGGWGERHMWQQRLCPRRERLGRPRSLPCHCVLPLSPPLSLSIATLSHLSSPSVCHFTSRASSVVYK